MNEAGKKIFHFNSNIRSKSGSKASMSNNEDRYLRALEIQELKREIREEELEKQRVIEEAKAKIFFPCIYPEFLENKSIFQRFFI